MNAINITTQMIPESVHDKSQRLNNRAAHSIENGNYEAAIQDLSYAMALSNDDFVDFCDCDSCSLEHCMTYSQQCSMQSDCKIETLSSEHDDSIPPFTASAVGFICRMPLRVPPMNPSGPILPLAITYNLALANQLNAMNELYNASQRRSMLQQALKFYELAYRWQMEEDLQSLAFRMMLANNLGEIHRAADNKSKHEVCLQHLLSTVMYFLVVDDDDGRMPIDGFLQNTASLIFNGGCAGAA